MGARIHTDKKEWKTLKDFQAQNLSSAETFNVWCDHMAQKERLRNCPTQMDPEVLPDEQWAIYSIHPQRHKLIGDLSKDILSSLGYNAAYFYLDQKHNLGAAKLHNIN